MLSLVKQQTKEKIVGGTEDWIREKTLQGSKKPQHYWI
jgi:hypothetical protein